VEPVAAAEIELDAWSKMPSHDTATDPSERAINIWIAEHGAPHAKCADEARAAVIHVMRPADVAHYCHEAVGEVAGCAYDYDADGSSIVVSAYEDSHDLRTHEIMHVLHECQQGVGFGDSDHVDTVWLHLPVAW
jgi:hypothetical protein